MPSPVYSAGAPGNLINGVSVAKGTTVAAFLDLSAAYEGQVVCEMTTGATAPTAATTFSIYKVYGNATPVTLSAAAILGATSVSVSSAAGINVGQNIVLQQASGSKLGEVVTVSGVSGTTLTLKAGTINAYSSGDSVYLIAQNAVIPVAPQNPSGGWTASTDYSAPVTLGTGQYVVAAANGDAAQAVTVTVSVDKVVAYV